MHPTDFEFALRLLLATGCGLIIGLERQFRSRTAGLRTQALVAAGAAVFVLFGEQTALPQAPLQIAAYVVSGVGFLGGGVILRQGFTVQGLNTAATLWCSAAVGCQAAAGHVIPALTTTGVVIGIHLLLRPLGRLVDRAPALKDESVGRYTLHVLVRRKQEPQLRAQLVQALSGAQFALRSVTSGETEASSTGTGLVELRVELLIEGNAHALLDNLVTRLSLEQGVSSLSWTSDDAEHNSDDDRDEHTPSVRRRWIKHDR